MRFATQLHKHNPREWADQMKCTWVYLSAFVTVLVILKSYKNTTPIPTLDQEDLNTVTGFNLFPD